MGGGEALGVGGSTVMRRHTALGCGGEGGRAACQASEPCTQKWGAAHMQGTVRWAPSAEPDLSVRALCVHVCVCVCVYVSVRVRANECL